MEKKLVLVLDCGATNIRTIAVDEGGGIAAVSSLPNNTRPDPENPDHRIWDVHELWEKFGTTTREVLSQIDAGQIVAITVTTFGVDGAPFTHDGKMLYPVISWQCPRTVPVMENIDKYIPLQELYSITGLQPFTFNTINKLIWLRENRPEVVERTDHFLFISSIFLYYLSGEMVTDITMAGTSMLTDLRKRAFSGEILRRIGYDVSLFPEVCEPGTVIGRTTQRAAGDLGLPAGIPVVAAGHDTQFAIYGSGAGENDPVLSSGTWEILMVRSRNITPDEQLLHAGVTTELDVTAGLYNPGIQWIASGMLEWIRKMFFSREYDRKDIYDIMVGEAEKVPVGSQGVRINPAFYSSGENAGGLISGLTMDTTRGAVYRAALEALVFKTKHSLTILEKTGGFRASQLLLVGGGSKNRLWNQLRADILGIPVKVVKQRETTVLGAALFALAGTGVYPSAEEARKHVDYTTEDYLPAGDGEKYEEIWQDYLKIFR
jgi:L-fuculokinase